MMKVEELVKLLDSLDNKIVDHITIPKLLMDELVI